MTNHQDDLEPRGCATPGCCAAVDTIARLEAELAEAKQGYDKAITLVGQNEIRIAQLKAELAEARRERDGWEESARQFSRNADFYRDILVSIGEKFGAPAYISDDGSVQDSVLVLRVSELVDAALAALADRHQPFRGGHHRAGESAP